MTTTDPVRPLCDPIPIPSYNLCPELSQKSGFDRDETRVWWEQQSRRIRGRLACFVCGADDPPARPDGCGPECIEEDK